MIWILIAVVVPIALVSLAFVRARWHTWRLHRAIAAEWHAVERELERDLAERRARNPYLRDVYSRED